MIDRSAGLWGILFLAFCPDYYGVEKLEKGALLKFILIQLGSIRDDRICGGFDMHFF